MQDASVKEPGGDANDATRSSIKDLLDDWMADARMGDGLLDAWAEADRQEAERQAAAQAIQQAAHGKATGKAAGAQGHDRSARKKKRPVINLAYPKPVRKQGQAGTDVTEPEYSQPDTHAKNDGQSETKPQILQSSSMLPTVGHAGAAFASGDVSSVPGQNTGAAPVWATAPCTLQLQLELQKFLFAAGSQGGLSGVPADVSESVAQCLGLLQRHLGPHRCSPNHGDGSEQYADNPSNAVPTGSAEAMEPSHASLGDAVPAVAGPAKAVHTPVSQAQADGSIINEGTARASRSNSVERKQADASIAATRPPPERSRATHGPPASETTTACAPGPVPESWQTSPSVSNAQFKKNVADETPVSGGSSRPGRTFRPVARKTPVAAYGTSAMAFCAPSGGTTASLPNGDEPTAASAPPVTLRPPFAQAETQAATRSAFVATGVTASTNAEANSHHDACKTEAKPESRHEKNAHTSTGSSRGARQPTKPSKHAKEPKGSASKAHHPTSATAIKEEAKAVGAPQQVETGLPREPPQEQHMPVAEVFIQQGVSGCAPSTRTEHVTGEQAIPEKVRASTSLPVSRMTTLGDHGSAGTIEADPSPAQEGVKPLLGAALVTEDASAFAEAEKASRTACRFGRSRGLDPAVEAAEWALRQAVVQKQRQEKQAERRAAAERAAVRRAREQREREAAALQQRNQLRADKQRHLSRVVLKGMNMRQALMALGFPVGAGSAAEHAAWKKARIHHHPDQSLKRRDSLEDQIMSEEIFKLLGSYEPNLS